MLWLALRNFVRTTDVPPAPFQVNGKQRRDSSKFCGMFRVTDSEMVIDDRPNEQVLMTAEKWKDRKDSMELMTVRTCKITA